MIDEYLKLKAQNELLQACLLKVTKERDMLKEYQTMAIAREQALRVHLNAVRQKHHNDKVSSGD